MLKKSAAEQKEIEEKEEDAAKSAAAAAKAAKAAAAAAANTPEELQRQFDALHAEHKEMMKDYTTKFVEKASTLSPQEFSQSFQLFKKLTASAKKVWAAKVKTMTAAQLQKSCKNTDMSGQPSAAQAVFLAKRTEGGLQSYMPKAIPGQTNYLAFPAGGALLVCSLCLLALGFDISVVPRGASRRQEDEHEPDVGRQRQE